MYIIFFNTQTLTGPGILGAGVELRIFYVTILVPNYYINHLEYSDI